jgi:predicted glutamine amidotransferase
MCGIFGHSFQRKTKVPAGQREILIAALCVANSYRGAQSWGIYAAGQKGKAPKVRREVGDIANVDGLGSLAAYPVVFGHTRHATTGAVTRENQHPFKVGHILLAHNGMVWNHDELNRRYDRKCTVDSQHFAHHIADGLTLSDIEAYGALEWTDDKRPGTVFLARLRDGVLSCALIKNRKGKQVGCAWSSDKAHLTRALEASRLDYQMYEPLAEGQVYEVTGGVMYTTKRPALIVATPVVDRRAMRRAQRLTSGGHGDDDTGGWWGKHYPRRETTRTYTWDSRSGSIVPTSHNYLDRDADTLTTRKGEPYKRPNLSVVGTGDTTPPAGMLAEEGAGAPPHRDAEEDEDYDAEAARLGLVKMDEGIWSEPDSGAILDRDDIDDMLDAEEDEAMAESALALTHGETGRMTDAEEAAWERTMQIAIAAGANTTKQ